MVRIVLGLLLCAVPAALEMGGEMPDAWDGFFRPVFWIAAVALGLALVGAGTRAIVREMREERAYAQARRSRWMLSTLSRSVVCTAVLATLVAVGLASQAEVEEIRGNWPPSEQLLHLPRKEVLRLLSLGYREFAADLVWLRTIAYFGEHLHTDRKYRWLDHYLETVLHLDPRFREAYRYAGTVTMYNLRRITREAVLASNRYLEKGYRQFPTYWELPFMLCANYLFELPRFAHDAAERRRLQEIGAEYCREASLLPGAMQYLPSMAGGVLSRLGKRQLAERHFRELILRTEDPKVRKQLEERYAALVSEQAARQIQEEADAFFRAHRESFPYVSPDLFVHLGARGSVPDAAAVIRRALRRR